MAAIEQQARSATSRPARLRASIRAAAGLLIIAIGLLLLGTPPAIAQGTPWAKRLTGYLPARDGTMLKYSVLLPAETGRFPAIMNYSGYDPGSIGGSAYQAGNTTMSPELDARLLEEGYAVIGVNMAGTGCSDGTFDLFARRWRTDGYDAIEWAAKRPWSNGRFGMANWSYAGLSQVMTATTRPPHLRAIAPGMAVTDPWRDVGFPGGLRNELFPVLWSGFIQSRWSAAEESAVAEGDGKCLANLAEHNATFPAVSPAANLESSPYPSDIPHGSVWRDTHRINIPVLSMVAWQDEATGPRAGYYQDSLDPRKTFLVGSNGPHDIYYSVRWQRLLVRFFDRYVKAERNRFDKQPHVRLWEDTTAPAEPSLPADGGELSELVPGEVIERDRWPLDLEPKRWALRAGGRLTARQAGQGEAPDSYGYPDPGPTVNEYLGSMNGEWRNDPPSADGTLAYTTPPLRRTLTFAGSGSLNLWVSSTAPDADVQATVTEVRPDGQEVYVQRGWLRLSQRALDRKHSTPLRPFHHRDPSTEAPLTDDDPVLARVEIQQFSHIFRRGSAIRIWLDAPSTTGEWGFISLTDPSQISVFHDRRHPSQLVLGLLQQGGIDSPRPPCDSLLRQPCRPDPISVPEP